MPQAIPADYIVAVTPSVLAAGGRGLDFNGLMLTTSTRIAIGSVPSFPDQLSVADFFGDSSTEATLAATYFLGFDNSNRKPGALLFSQYNSANVGAWLRGFPVSSLSLTQLQAISGILTITIDGTPHTSSSIDLSTVTSFGAASRAISTALGVAGPTVGTATGSQSTTTITVTTTPTAPIAVGHAVAGIGVPTGTYITAFGSGVGGTGTYTVNTSATAASTTLTFSTPVVTYDSVAGSFLIQSATTGASSTIGYGSASIAAPLGLTAATGAIISQGAVAATPASAMNTVIQNTQNFVSFMTMFDPDNGSGNANKLLFAAWNNSQNNRYIYVAWDTDVGPAAASSNTPSFGYIADSLNNYSGTFPIWSLTKGPTMAAYQLGMAACINPTQLNGRVTAKFRKQTGLAADVTDLVTITNLKSNSYNAYVRVSTANDAFTFMSEGTVTGPFKWFDTYINQIWMRNQFQLALIQFLMDSYSVPYNDDGYGAVRACLLDPINQAFNFGAIRAGVTLSNEQMAQVNNATGLQISTTIRDKGWYLYIGDALPQVRQFRQSPPMIFFYSDGESIQQIALSSITIQ